MTEQKEAPKRMTLSNVVERLTERRPGTSSVTLKLSAQGVFMPEVTVAAHEDEEVVTRMVDQAVKAFTDLHERAAKPNGSGQ